MRPSVLCAGGLLFSLYITESKNLHSEIKKCVITKNVNVKIVLAVHLVNVQQKINVDVNNYGEKLCYH